MKGARTALLLLVAGNSHAADVIFSQDIVPLLERNCASCHLVGTEPGKLSLHGPAAHASLVDRPAAGAEMLLVSPGEPGNSYLLHKLRGTHLDAGGSGARMPFASPALPDNIIELIETWIRNGAANN